MLLCESRKVNQNESLKASRYIFENKLTSLMNVKILLIMTALNNNSCLLWVKNETLYLKV